MKRNAVENGFTLVEMVAVVTVISLIMGAIVLGQTAIRSAQLNAVLSDVARYHQAIADFRDKYIQYPGDLPNATQYWGTDPAGCPTPTTGAGGPAWSPTPHTGTCNGDGNNLIGQSGVLDAGGYVAAGPGAYEWYRAWQQLSDAGFIDSTYNGMMGPASANNAVLGINVPASRLKGGGYSLFYASYPAGGGNWFSVMDHVIVFGTVNGTGWTNGPILTASEAHAVDAKLDDGVPNTGKVMTFTSALQPNCTTSPSVGTYVYNYPYQDNACSMIFVLDFNY